MSFQRRLIRTTSLRSAGRGLRAAGLGAGAAVVVVLSSLVPSVAHAAEDERITWAVSPASESGPDGRAGIEVTLDPGDSVVEHLAVQNLGDVSTTFELVAADGYMTHTGRFNMLPRTEESVGAGLWIDIERSVEVDAGETIVVPFTITVPDDATPGDHAAGVAAAVFSVRDAEGGSRLGVDSRVGFRVMTRVTGELDPSLTIAEPRAEYRMSWNPFAPGAVATTFDMVNDGNTRLSVSGTVSAAGSSRAFGSHESDDRVELLPGDARTISVVLDDVWPTVRVPVDVRTHVETASADGEWSTLATSPVSGSTSTWAIPWSQLAVLAGLALIVGAFGVQRGRHRKRMDELLAQAREEGRSEALTPSSMAEDGR